MYTILTISIFLWITFIVLRNIDKPIIAIEDNGISHTEIDNFTWFGTFSLFTAPLFLSDIKEAKYILWFFLVCWLILKKKYALYPLVYIKHFSFFFIWACIGVFIGGAWVRGSLTLVKYSLIAFYFLIGYHIPNPDKKLIYVFKYAEIGILLALVTVSGIVAKLGIWQLYLFFIHFFFSRGGISDYFSAVSPICLALFYTDEKKWYHFIVYILCLLSSIFFVIRTGIGSFFVGAVIFFFYRYRSKSPLILIPIIILFFATIFLIPTVRQKMFTNEIQETNTPLTIQSLFDSQNRRDNGRNDLIEMALIYFQNANKIIGAGTGALTTQLRVWNAEEKTAAIAHNDYLVIYIDHGILGCLLFFIFIVITFFNIFRHLASKSQYFEIQLLGQCAVASLGSCLFAMRFENIIAHVMSSIGISFLLLGMFYRAIDEVNARSTHTTQPR